MKPSPNPLRSVTHLWKWRFLRNILIFGKIVILKPSANLIRTVTQVKQTFCSPRSQNLHQTLYKIWADFQKRDFCVSLFIAETNIPFPEPPPNPIQNLSWFSKTGFLLKLFHSRNKSRFQNLHQTLYKIWVDFQKRNCCLSCFPVVFELLQATWEASSLGWIRLEHLVSCSLVLVGMSWRTQTLMPHMSTTIAETM